MVARIEEIKPKHAVYEANFTDLEQRLDDAEGYLDNMEQYSRRTSLRIYGIPLPEAQQSAADCVN